jgi:DNA-binding beta-propeller fold protein YncE
MLKISMAVLTLLVLPPRLQPAQAPNGDGGPATSAQLNYPNVVKVDTGGNLYIADPNNSRIRKVTASSGIIDTIAGGTRGNGGDGGPATAAQFFNPQDIAVDAAGNLYIADMTNSRIRKVAPEGRVSTLVFSPNPFALTVDAADTLYVAGLNNRVGRVIAGTIQPLAGDGTRGYGGDGGPAVSAQLSLELGANIAVDPLGNVYIADVGNQRVREVTRDGMIRTIAGNGNRGFGGDGCPAVLAQLYNPKGVAVDAVGNLYIADSGNVRIRIVTADGVIRTIAGNGTSGLTGDGGPATMAQLNEPTGVAIDNAGNLYIADRINGRIRKITKDGAIITVAGSTRPPGVLGGVRREPNE